jgi:hypothetical protein
MAERQIPPERKGLYYVGLALVVIGFLTFFSTFITAAMHFGDFSNFDRNAKSSFGRAIAGMGMIIVGGIVMRIGATGLAGSGLKLDPEQAREDVEPWSRMAGGVVKDVLDEAGIKPGTPSAQQMPVEERLRRLDKLRDEKLINDHEYAETRKRVLDSV